MCKINLYSLLHIKCAANRAIDNFEPLNDIKNWQADEQDIQNKSLAVGLKCEETTIELQAIVDMADALLCEPPAYTASGQDDSMRNLQLWELLVSCERAQRLNGEVQELLEDVDEVAMESEQGSSDIGIAEAMMRAASMKKEICRMLERASGLVMPWGP